MSSAFPAVNLIHNAQNAGFGAACNQAIAASKSDLILLLNSDAAISPVAFKELVHVMESEPCCGAAGCTIVNAEGQMAVNTRNFLTPFNQAFELSGLSKILRISSWTRTCHPKPDASGLDCSVDWIDGACLMLRRAALDEAGVFDEQFFIYSEDEDLCYRFRKRGWSVCYSARASVIHHGAASADQDRPINFRHFYESQILFIQKYLGPNAASRFIVAMRCALAFKRVTSLLLFRPTSKKNEIELRRSALLAARSVLDRASHAG